MKHYPIIVDGVIYESTADLVNKLNLDVKSNVLYKRCTKHKKEFTLDELNEIVELIKTKTRIIHDRISTGGNQINLGDVIYEIFNTSNNFEYIEDFLAGIPVKGMPDDYFIDYFTFNYNKSKIHLPVKVTLDYLMEVLHYYFKGEIHPDLVSLFPGNGKKREVRGKKLTDYAKEYGLKYNLVYTIYWDTKDLDNPEEAFIKQLKEKYEKLVLRKNKTTE